MAIFVFASFFSLLSDSGLAVAIIQRKVRSDQDIFSLFVIAVIIGSLLGLLFGIVVGPISASFYNNQVYISIAWLLAVSLFLYSTSIVSWALLFRDKRFKTIGFSNFLLQILSPLFAIYLAWKGFSGYSLIYQSIFSSALRFIIVYFLAPVKFYKKINFEL